MALTVRRRPFRRRRNEICLFQDAVLAPVRQRGRLAGLYADALAPSAPAVQIALKPVAAG